MLARAKAAKARSKQQLPEPEINVTPLVDVVLVLLIIFMVIAPNLQEGVPVVLPEVKSIDDEKLEDAIEVVLDQDAQTHLDDEPIARPQLFETLAGMHRDEPTRALILKAHSELAYGVVRELFVALQKAGFSNVSLKVSSPEAGDS